MGAGVRGGIVLSKNVKFLPNPELDLSPWKEIVRMILYSFSPNYRRIANLLATQHQGFIVTVLTIHMQPSPSDCLVVLTSHEDHTFCPCFNRRVIVSFWRPLFFFQSKYGVMYRR